MTWTELAMRAGAQSEAEADFLLWNATAFPFASPRIIWHQLRHVIRHQVCCGNPEAQCKSARRPERERPNE